MAKSTNIENLAELNELRNESKKYSPVKALGKGAQGVVLLAEDRHTNEPVAVKMIQRGPTVNERVQREVLNHQILFHPHIINFREVFLTSKHLCITMEYAKRGTLLSYVQQKRKLTEDEARHFFQQLIVGLDHCHQKGVISRDVKLENTLVDGSDPPKLKICDFGFSKREIFDSAPHSRVGTPSYLAPEIVSSSPGKTYEGKPTDIWSSGVFLYAMVMGKYPFDRPDERQKANRLIILLERIVKGDYHLPRDKLSNDLCDLLSRMLEHNPQFRITIEEIMKHPWFLAKVPPEILMMNRQLKGARSRQSTEDIMKFVNEAKSIGEPSIDELIDQELEHMAAKNREAYAAGQPVPQPPHMEQVNNVKKGRTGCRTM